jgi:hypothetical protein
MQAPRPWPVTARRQRGWAGLIGLLIALLIVAWLGRTLLVRLLPEAATAGDAAKPRHAGNRVPGGASPADVDVGTATPSARNELERARGLESAVRDQAADLSKRIDEQAK